ncbi:MAG TPA: DUF6457 domain-containing protein [Acidimicrobiales bacterium]|jgi:hypothetical protein|nr:DUF6457 domain-containing protein [Acidimicrobiales bacterium]
MTTSAADWLASYSEALGIEAPTEEEVNQILALAGVAAHSSERTAAPVACWLAARAGLGLSDAQAIALRLSDESA